MNKVMCSNNIFTAGVFAKGYNVKVIEKESGDAIIITRPNEDFKCALHDIGYSIDNFVVDSLVVSEERIELVIHDQARNNIILHKLPSNVCKFSCDNDGKLVIEIFRKGRAIHV